MADFANVIKDENNISIYLAVDGKVLKIGEKMNEINDDAYMNGYNWEAFFNYYLPKYAPDIMAGMNTDSESGTYVVYYDLTSENEKKANKFAEIINKLIENEEELCRIVREDGDEIEWD